MPHRRLVSRKAYGRAYDPVTLTLLREAFDAAWAVVSNDHREQPEERRAELAMLILAIANSGERDVAAISRKAVRWMRFEIPTVH